MCSLGSALVRHDRSTFLLQLKNTSWSGSFMSAQGLRHMLPSQCPRHPYSSSLHQRSLTETLVTDMHAAPSFIASFVPPVPFQPLVCSVIRLCVKISGTRVQGSQGNKKVNELEPSYQIVLLGEVKSFPITNIFPQ